MSRFACLSIIALTTTLAIAAQNVQAQTPPQAYGWGPAKARVACAADDVGNVFKGDCSNIALPNTGVCNPHLSAGQISRCAGAEK